MRELLKILDGKAPDDLSVDRCGDHPGFGKLLLSLGRHCYLGDPVVALQLTTHHQLRRHHSLDDTRHRRERYHGRLGELPDTARTLLAQRSEERRVGKECVHQCSSLWAQYL